MPEVARRADVLNGGTALSGFTSSAILEPRIGVLRLAGGMMAAAAGDAGGVALPIGTVTLLLADIEGSTQLWEADAAAMTAAIARYDAIVSDAIGRHEGVRPIEQGEGDSFVAAFSRASDAVRCAFELQELLSRAEDPVPLRVRMAIHTGEVQQRDEGNYVGSAINRCARLRALARGGQTLLSQTTHDLVVDAFADDVMVIDHGLHRLRDLTRPERVYEVRHQDFICEFPPLRSLDTKPHNLPVQLTTFIGREAEVEQVTALVQQHRLVTLTGSGGSGKTRLALHVAAEILDRVPDGVWFVDLAPIEETGLLDPAIAAALGVREQRHREVAETIAETIGDRTLLVVLDNCEHLLEAAARSASVLLGLCPGLSILATSRERLDVPGEVTYRVPSLSVPAVGDVPHVESLATYEAVALFIERAVKARPNFQVDNENAPAVAEICRRLDGIPLAIELAAARIRMLTARQICDGLTDRFRLLTGGARTSMPRQQTLRASVDWSFELLSDVERVLLRRLSVFSGGCTLDAAEEVAGFPPLTQRGVLDLLTSLVDKSLVLVDDHHAEARFRLLETIRQYAARHVIAEREESVLAERHRAHYLRLLARAAEESTGPQQSTWAERVAVELDNLRASLNAALRDGAGDALLELTCAMGTTWGVLGLYAEQARWVDTALGLSDPSSTDRAAALYQLGNAMMQEDLRRAVGILTESVRLYHAQGDEAAALWPLAELAAATVVGAPEAGMRLYQEAIEKARALAEDVAGWYLQFALGSVYTALGRPDLGCAALEAVLEQPTPVEHHVRWARSCLGVALVAQGEIDRARALLETVAADTPATDGVTPVIVGWTLAACALEAGRLDEAGRQLDDADRLFDAGGWSELELTRDRARFLLAGGDADGAAAILRRTLPTARNQGWLSAITLMGVLGEAELATGDFERAGEHLDETIAGWRAADCLGHSVHLSMALHRVAALWLATGDLERAEGSVHESLAAYSSVGAMRGVVDCLELLGTIAAALESFDEASRLFGAASSLRGATGYRLRMPHDQAPFDAAVATARERLRQKAFREAWNEGAALSWQDAVDYARRGRGERKRPSSGWSSLTPTEEKVVALVVEGLTNAQIGERLFISRRTVDTHLGHVFAKLSVSSRTDLAARAIRRGQPTTERLQ